jgi:hypothetical protein
MVLKKLYLQPVYLKDYLVSLLDNGIVYKHLGYIELNHTFTRDTLRILFRAFGCIDVGSISTKIYHENQRKKKHAMNISVRVKYEHLFN